MIEIYNSLSDIILYVVSGYIFLYTYKTTRIVERSKEQEHIIVESLIFGYIINNIALVIPISLGYYADIICIVIASAVSGFLCAKFISSRYTNYLIDKLGIRQTKFRYMWQNICDPELAIFIDVTDSETKNRYYGQLLVFEDFEKYPIIQICKYVYWQNDEEIADYSNDPTRTVLIDTSKYSEIEIIYQESSEFIKRWA